MTSWATLEKELKQSVLLCALQVDTPITAKNVFHEPLRVDVDRPDKEKNTYTMSVNGYERVCTADVPLWTANDAINSFTQESALHMLRESQRSALNDHTTIPGFYLQHFDGMEIVVSPTLARPPIRFNHYSAPLAMAADLVKVNHDMIVVLHDAVRKAHDDNWVGRETTAPRSYAVMNIDMIYNMTVDVRRALQKRAAEKAWMATKRQAYIPYLW